MSGFKNFILRGNLVEIAVGLIMALAFVEVVNATVGIIMDLLGKVGGTPNFSNYTPGGISVGAFLTALVAFVIMAAVVYFIIVVPYAMAQERYFPSDDPGEPADVALLTEIRDLLARQQGSSAGTHI